MVKQQTWDKRKSYISKIIIFSFCSILSFRVTRMSMALTWLLCGLLEITWFQAISLIRIEHFVTSNASVGVIIAVNYFKLVVLDAAQDVFYTTIRTIKSFSQIYKSMACANFQYFKTTCARTIIIMALKMWSSAGWGEREHGVCFPISVDSERHHWREHFIRPSDGQSQVPRDAPQVCSRAGPDADGAGWSDGDWGAGDQPEWWPKATHSAGTGLVPGLGHLPPGWHFQCRGCSHGLTHLPGNQMHVSFESSQLPTTEWTLCRKYLASLLKRLIAQTEGIY